MIGAAQAGNNIGNADRERERKVEAKSEKERERRRANNREIAHSFSWNK